MHWQDLQELHPDYHYVTILSVLLTNYELEISRTITEIFITSMIRGNVHVRNCPNSQVQQNLEHSVNKLTQSMAPGERRYIRPVYSSYGAGNR
jgi:hypothetical protein